MPIGSRHQIAVRLVRLIARLNNVAVRPTAPDLARELGMRERTIRRDIAALAEAHYPMPPTFDQVERA